MHHLQLFSWIQLALCGVRLKGPKADHQPAKVHLLASVVYADERWPSHNKLRAFEQGAPSAWHSTCCEALMAGIHPPPHKAARGLLTAEGCVQAEVDSIVGAHEQGEAAQKAALDQLLRHLPDRLRANGSFRMDVSHLASEQQTCCACKPVLHQDVYALLST